VVSVNPALASSIVSRASRREMSLMMTFLVFV
jgi:hypothetical protein